jgi:hypothetical protein
MLNAVGHLLPVAVAVALSSVPIMATILILLSPKRDRSALPFLIGWVIGIIVVVALCTALAQALPDSAPKQPQVAIGIGEIVIGLAAGVFAVVSWRRSVRNPSGDVPKWLNAASSFGPLASFGVAFVLNLRPKGIILGIAAGLVLRSAALGPGDTAIAIAIYTVIAASTVAAPIIVTLAAPVRMQPRLVTARDWITRNNRLVSALIMMMIAVVIIGDGLTRL